MKYESIFYIFKKYFFDVDYFFLSLFWIFYNIASVLCFGFLAMRYGILAPWPGIEPTPAAFEGKVLTIGPPGKSPSIFFFKSHFFADW